MLERPLVMGIVNVTPDSFSDGGEHEAPDAAVAHARVVEIIDAMKRGGVKRFALMIAPK